MAVIVIFVMLFLWMLDNLETSVALKAGLRVLIAN